MKRATETRLSRLEEARAPKKRGIAYVEVPRGQTLEEALAYQGIRGEDYNGLFVIVGRIDDAAR